MKDYRTKEKRKEYNKAYRLKYKLELLKKRQSNYKKITKLYIYTGYQTYRYWLFIKDTKPRGRLISEGKVFNNRDLEYINNTND